MLLFQFDQDTIHLRKECRQASSSRSACFSRALSIGRIEILCQARSFSLLRRALSSSLFHHKGQIFHTCTACLPSDDLPGVKMIDVLQGSLWNIVSFFLSPKRFLKKVENCQQLSSDCSRLNEEPVPTMQSDFFLHMRFT